VTVPRWGFRELDKLMILDFFDFQVVKKPAYKVCQK